MLTQSVWFVLLLVGTVTSFPQSRVVNGTDSDIQKFPFMVSLRVWNAHSCGGTIIASNWILTAAHCTEMYRSNPSALTIQYGVTNIDSEGPNIATVKRIIIHEDYDPTKYYANDISLLELDAHLVCNYKTVDLVTVPKYGFETPQHSDVLPGILIGWGFDKSGGNIQDRLQEVDLIIFSDNKCNSIYSGRTNGDQICGGTHEGGKGHCNGDSGGPLLYQGFVQVGIVSWGITPCAKYPYPGVYTKVSHFVDWIHAHTK